MVELVEFASFRNYWSSTSPLRYLNNYYQQDSRVLYTFIPNRLFGQLLDIWPKKSILKTFDSEFLYIEVWFTAQNSEPWDIENKINITLVTD